MCGIAGFLDPTLDPRDYPATLLAMLARLTHRGPDGTGTFVDDRCALGTTRLAIIDLESGMQPLSDAEERFFICYNGELYNYKELRAELEAKGFTFRTSSDTEVVLQAWICWREGCLPRFNGGFAFAIYDRAESALFLARDRFGKRPLFYSRGQAGFLFASEMKAFLAYPGFGFEPDPAQLASILAQWTPLPDQTGFRGIESLPMGEWMKVSRGEIVQKRYASIRFDEGPLARTEAEAIDLVRARLLESVRLRLRSDVEVGVYLSGGLDSAIIAHLAQETSRHRLSTFSVEFEDAAFDESREQHEVSRFLGTRHESVRISHADIARTFPEALFHAEVPAFRSAFVPMFLLSQTARAAGIKVVLTGEGADEAFLGYDLFKETILRTTFRSLDQEARREKLSNLYPHLDHYGPQESTALFGLYQQFSEERMPGLFSHELRFQNGRFSARLLRSPGDPFRAVTELVAREPGYATMTPVQKAQWLEFQTLLPGYLLSTQGERMSLAHGVENRCPFLDPNVVAAASSVNLRFDDGFNEKYLLRKAFREHLPASVVEKRKFPYRAPDSAAFVATAPDYLELLLSDAELAKLGYLDSKFARALTKKVFSTPAAQVSTKENQAFIFLVSLVLLHQLFVERKGAPLETASRPREAIKSVDKRSARESL